MQTSPCSRKTVLALAAALIVGGMLPAANAPSRQLSAEAYADKVYASWLGQCVGNFFGLLHENKYVEEIPEDIPREYGGWPLERMRELDGAFSDDDTDIEYMYLFLMEEKGVEPSYRDIAERWIRHINLRIWVANYAARNLMSRGYLPPDTGRQGLNEHWFQIDPQLVNEVWAVTAPGMVDYAAAKSDWAARVTNDDYGTHPTVWYGAMYSAAFFESDLHRLYDIGLAQVPPGRFRDALVLVRSMYQEGRPWRETRRVIKAIYYDQEPSREESRPSAPQKSIWSAALNGAMGALALLYGEGDFEETLYLSCMAGFDCDNQAATLAGLMGVAGGTTVLPRKYLYPVDTWTKPFNDNYVMASREHLPSDTLTRIAERTVRLGEQIIEGHGGRITSDAEGRKIYEIDPRAEFVPPLELRVHPVKELRAGEPARVELSVVGGWPIWRREGRFAGYDTAGEVRGIVHDILSDSPGLRAEVITQQPSVRAPLWAHQRPTSIVVLSGVPTQPGRQDFRVSASGLHDADERVELGVSLTVLDRNLAVHAGEVLVRVSQPTGGGERDREVLRDGERYAGSYDSYDGENLSELDWYGYQWERPQPIAQLIYTAGTRHRDGGWWETFDVEILGEDGAWRSVKHLRVSPNVLVEWGWPFRPYSITFDQETTRGVRIIGKPGGSAAFTSITELEVYSTAVEPFWAGD